MFAQKGHQDTKQNHVAEDKGRGREEELQAADGMLRGGAEELDHMTPSLLMQALGGGSSRNGSKEDRLQNQ